MDELLQDANVGLDLALRWLSALAVAHCRPRPGSAATDLQTSASARTADGDTEMADASAAADGQGAMPGSGFAREGAPAAGLDAATLSEVTKEPAEEPGSVAEEGRVAGGADASAAAAAAAAVQRQWAGLAGSPYETALLALLRACRCCASLSQSQWRTSSTGTFQVESNVRALAQWQPQQLLTASTTVTTPLPCYRTNVHRSAPPLK